MWSRPGCEPSEGIKLKPQLGSQTRILFPDYRWRNCCTIFRGERGCYKFLSLVHLWEMFSVWKSLSNSILPQHWHFMELEYLPENFHGNWQTSHLHTVYDAFLCLAYRILCPVIGKCQRYISGVCKCLRSKKKSKIGLCRSRENGSHVIPRIALL